jgi:hypothetical protein
MTTATKIRRNADGQQSIRDLRKALAKTNNSVYRQGGNWITSEWSEVRGCHMTETCPYHWTERQAIQSVLGEVESKDAAKYHAAK